MNQPFFSGYEVKELQFEVAGLPVRLLRAMNVDELLERLLAKGDTHEDVLDERIPYWAELWPSALGLARYLIENKIISPGTTVTELGCGLGLPGIVAGKLGGDVTLTDYLPEALEFARYNWSLNCEGEPRCVQLDWRQPDPALAADVLIASDITYEKRFFEFLPVAFRAMCKPGGQVIVSDPHRQVAFPFFENLPALGFEAVHTAYGIPAWVSTHRHTIDVYAIRPGPAPDRQ